METTEFQREFELTQERHSKVKNSKIFAQKVLKIM